jgi:superfamily II DNA or RNA helicase
VNGTITFVPEGGTQHGWYETDGRGHWAIEARPDVMIRLKRLFPRANKHRTGAMTLVSTPEICRDLAWVLDRHPLDMSRADRQRLKQGAREHEETEATVNAILTGGQLHFELTEPARPARDYQLVAADLALATHRLLLTDDLGLGKSMSGLLVLREPAALPALIVCPTHLPRQWMDELAKTLPFLRAHIVKSLQPYDPARRREMRGHDPDVLVMSYSKLRGWGDHLASRVQTVIFDEAQELRRADSDKYTAAAQIADQAVYRIGLTATPVYNYGGEIHNILSVLAPDVLGSREEFAREWCHGYWHDKITVSDPAALGCHLRDQGLMLRRTRKEVGRELPDVVRVPHSVDADADVFDELSGDALELAELILNTDAERSEVFTASGDFDWKMRQATGIAKAPYVADFTRMLLEAERKVVLFGWHRRVYEIWAERLAEFKPAFYTGEESPAQKQRSQEAFLSGDARVLVMSLRAGAGLDGLQEAAHACIFGELDWSPGMHDQCIGRLHRDGQDEPVVAYFLVSDEGADPVMAEVLNLKRMQSEPLRDPDAALFEEATGTQDRVRRLAAEVLRRRRPKRQLQEAA